MDVKASSDLMVHHVLGNRRWWLWCPRSQSIELRPTLQGVMEYSTKEILALDAVDSRSVPTLIVSVGMEIQAFGFTSHQENFAHPR